VTWLLDNTEVTSIPEGSYGFVYKIVNTVSGREYIGKKLFYSMKQKQVKGKKKKYKAESDWQNYFGSNDQLLKDVADLGEQHFQRTILKMCRTKGECSYYEAKYQFELDVLLFPEKYYNVWVMCKIHRKHLKLSEAG